MIFLFLDQNICCGYSKEPCQWDGSFGHPKHMLKLMDKKKWLFLRSFCAQKFSLSKPMLSNSNQPAQLHRFARMLKNCI